MTHPLFSYAISSRYYGVAVCIYFFNAVIYLYPVKIFVPSRQKGERIINAVTQSLCNYNVEVFKRSVICTSKCRICSFSDFLEKCLKFYHISRKTIYLNVQPTPTFYLFVTLQPNCNKLGQFTKRFGVVNNFHFAKKNIHSPM